MSSIYWIRHAPIVKNWAQKSVYVGHTDAPCEVPVGVDLQKAAQLKNTTWMSSDLQRATSTAQWLCAQLSCRETVQTDARLREQYFGAWEGKSHDEVYVQNPHLDWERPVSLQAQNGENFADVCARVGAFLDEILAQSNDYTIVAHAGSIRAGMAHALGLTPAQALNFCVDTGSMSVVRYVKGVGVISALNHPLLMQGEG